MTYTCLIIDDEQPARELLKNYVEKVPHLKLVKTCKNALEAIEMINNQPIDLIFLDIQMPDLTGIDMLKSLRHQPLTIFTTAYQEFALEGYQLDVADYLLKPFPFNRFVQAVNKACELIEIRHNKKTTSSPIDRSDTLIIKAEHKLYKIITEDIRYIEGLREYVTYHLADRKIISLQALKDIDVNLKNNGFVRVHKSFIVNKKWVEMIEGNQLKVGDKNIPVGASYKSQVLKEIFE